MTAADGFLLYALASVVSTVALFVVCFVGFMLDAFLWRRN
jgi:hypothetical protein